MFFGFLLPTAKYSKFAPSSTTYTFVEYGTCIMDNEQTAKCLQKDRSTIVLLKMLWERKPVDTVATERKKRNQIHFCNVQNPK